MSNKIFRMIGMMIIAVYAGMVLGLTGKTAYDITRYIMEKDIIFGESIWCEYGTRTVDELCTNAVIGAIAIWIGLMLLLGVISWVIISEIINSKEES